VRAARRDERPELTHQAGDLVAVQANEALHHPQAPRARAEGDVDDDG
jgi:hypothetical protein